MTNYQPIINPLLVIINLPAMTQLVPERFSETLVPAWPAEKSSTIHQLIQPNRKHEGQIYR